MAAEAEASAVAMVVGGSAALSLARIRGQPTEASQALKALRMEVNGAAVAGADGVERGGEVGGAGAGKEGCEHGERGHGGHLEVAGEEEEQDGIGGKHRSGRLKIRAFWSKLFHKQFKRVCKDIFPVNVKL